uniref:Ubiquinol oxidase n=1 Tax=Tetradesmus obliquus TaxID=3088 RepID=A0A383WPK4_TETOB|eukprot:jgi/Sobl393_1/18802/SZX79109.1
MRTAQQLTCSGQRYQRTGLITRSIKRASVIKCVATPVSQPARQTLATDSQEPTDNCRFFVDRDGEMIRIMCCDYGFRAGAGRLYQDKYGEVPDNVLVMAGDNFQHELSALRRSVRYNEYAALEAPPNALARVAGSAGKVLVSGLSRVDSWLEARGLLGQLQPAEVPADVQGEDGQLNEECQEIRAQLRQLKLNDAEVWAREERRKKESGDVDAPWFIKAPFWLLCVMLDVCFANRPIQRFWVLETVARIPYFAYISILHLYESLGFWRAGAELRKVHFAEEWNELHHLQIMESLGGDQLWFDRFIAQHAALLYYWVLIVIYLFSPKLAYAFSELVELHAADTYEQFVESNQEALAALPPPLVAAAYYRNEDLYMVGDLYMVSKRRVPKLAYAFSELVELHAADTYEQFVESHQEALAALPPPLVAAAYYRNEDLYMFDELQTCSGDDAPLRRPPCSSLLDVFNNIRDDEVEHVKTMHACQDTKLIAEQLAGRRKKLAAEGLSSE